MKKILFPTDFSTAADNAFIYALRLAKKTGATVTTLHTYQMPNLNRANLPRTVQEVYESINLEEFENYRDRIPRLTELADREGLSGVGINHRLEEGLPAKTIMQVAKDEEVSLIVMGTSGISGLKKMVLGSVAAEVMENAPCPVVAVPHRARFDGWLNRVAFATEFKAEESKALRWLLDWLAPTGADVYGVHVDVSHTEALARRLDTFKVDFLTDHNLTFEVVDDTDVEPALQEFLQKNKIDLLAMVIHQRNFVQELFTFSLTKKLATKLETPILALPAKLFAAGRPKFNPPVLGLG